MSEITPMMHQKWSDAETYYLNKMTGRERMEAYKAFMQQWIDPQPESIMCESNYNDFIWWLSTQEYSKAQS